jgi:FixJ family two-component response regulator
MAPEWNGDGKGSMEAVIHLIDDDESFRKAVSRMLRAAGYEVHTYASAGDFLLSYQGNDLACVLLDVRMPGPSGLDLQASLAAKGISCPIIFLTGHATIPITVRAMKAGAVDFLTKPVNKEDLLNAIRKALDLHCQESSVRAELAACKQCIQTLTPREQQVFDGVVTGKLNKQIAAELGISERTIKAHRAQVMEKMRVQSVAQLVHIFHQLHSDSTGQHSRSQN